MSGVASPPSPATRPGPGGTSSRSTQRRSHGPTASATSTAPNPTHGLHGRVGHRRSRRIPWDGRRPGDVPLIGSFRALRGRA